MKHDRHLDILYDLSAAVVGTSRFEDVCQKLLARITGLFKVNKASIMKYDPTEKVLKIIAAIGLPKEIVSDAEVKIGEGISGKVFKSAKPILIKDIKASGFKAKKRYKTRSLMSAPVTCFPLRFGKTPVGVINVTDKKAGGVFTPDDLNLLNTVSNQVAAYLHLCDLAEEARKGEHLRQEVGLAREIQQRLLPRSAPKIQGFDVAGACITAEHVGGDYFDYLIGGARAPSIVVADVAGHSIAAAMTMAAFRSAVRSESAATLLSPSIVAEKLNAILYDDLIAAEQFISMVYLQLFPDALKYTTAGHHPPLILRGKNFINHSTEDILLGVEKFAEYHEKRIDLKKGDVVVLFTDGLVNVIGLEGLKRFLIRVKAKTAEGIVNAICEYISSSSKSKSLKDDVTVVVIKA